MRDRRIACYSVLVFVFLIEAFGLDGWFLACFVAVCVALTQMRPPRDRAILIAPVIMLALLFATRGINDWIASRQGGAIAAACESYQAKHGAFPSALEDLVPAQLSSVPSGRIALSG